jgi:hypothetical protein
MSKCPTCDQMPERPHGERIDNILKNRHFNVRHFHMRYEARRDYLQLCAEIDHLRNDLQRAREFCTTLPADTPEQIFDLEGWK